MDVVVVRNVLHYLAMPAKALREIYRVLAQNGALIMVEL